MVLTGSGYLFMPRTAREAEIHPAQSGPCAATSIARVLHAISLRLDHIQAKNYPEPLPTRHLYPRPSLSSLQLATRSRYIVQLQSHP